MAGDASGVDKIEPCGQIFSFVDAPADTRQVKGGAAAGFVCLMLVGAGCGGATPGADETMGATSSVPVATSEFGSYPADTSLDEKEVVEAYVDALDARDGRAFCRIVTSWISGHFDIAGTDPDASLRRPLRCPELVPALTDFPWENQERDFKGASVAEFGALHERGNELVGVPVTITLRLEEDARGEYEEPLEDVVWVTREAGAWRVAKLSTVAGWASLIATERGDDLTAPPDIDAERRSFASEAANARQTRSAREGSYRAVKDTATCPDAKAYADGSGDVVDYQHPAPPTPTPQLPAADIRTLRVHASEERICVLFELAGDVRTDTVFDFTVSSPDFDWGRSGFAQQFEVDLRTDGRARVTSGRGDQGRPVSVPAKVGKGGNRLMLALDAKSFAAGRPLPGSVTVPGPSERFDLRADVTVRVSVKRLLHDDLGPGPPEGTRTYPYP
jgi:hypothetical protein